MQPVKSSLYLLVLFTGFLMAGPHAWCQKEVIIKGKVFNESGIPVKEAVVKLGNSDTRTNSEGIFITRNSKFPVQIKVSHTLYAEYLNVITLTPGWTKDTLKLAIVLSNKETQLDEVTVSAEKIFWVYPKKSANVLDFVLQPNDEIMLCCSDNNNYFIRNLDSQGEKITEVPIRRNPKKLFRDCMQTIHLLYSDSIYETAVINNTIGIFQPKLAAGIFHMLQSCVYKDEKTLVKYHYSNQNQSIEYYAIDTKTQQAVLLYTGANQKWNQSLSQYTNRDSSGNELFHTTNKYKIRAVRERWYNQQFYEQILTQPVYIPLFELNDSLVIFDHLNDSVVVFSKSGALIRSYPISYHYLPGWKNELVTNVEKTKIYARYESDGLTTLREINLTNGEVEQSISLEKHIFPKRLQIRGNFIYYLYKDYLDQSMHYLYKQPLKENL